MDSSKLKYDFNIVVGKYEGADISINSGNIAIVGNADTGKSRIMQNIAYEFFKNTTPGRWEFTALSWNSKWCDMFGKRCFKIDSPESSYNTLIRVASDAAKKYKSDGVQTMILLDNIDYAFRTYRDELKPEWVDKIKTKISYKRDNGISWVISAQGFREHVYRQIGVDRFDNFILTECEADCWPGRETFVNLCIKDQDGRNGLIGDNVFVGTIIHNKDMSVVSRGGYSNVTRDNVGLDGLRLEYHIWSHK